MKLKIKTLVCFIFQWTWGIGQSLLGFIVLLLHIKDNTHYWFHGAFVSVWNKKSSVSLGMFIFVTKEPYFYDKLKDQYNESELSQRLLVHEYGHTIQSLILGPLYLIVMGIPSTIWGFSPKLCKCRHEKGISYFSFFTEKWANRLGEAVTNEKSMENLVID